MYITLKGQSHEIFYLRFLHRWTSLTRYLKTFRIWLQIRRVIAIFYWLSAIIMESQYSQYCLIRRVGESLLSELSAETLACRLIRESQYSSYCLIRRVTTPGIIYSGESLLTLESYLQKLWKTPPSFKGMMKQKINYPCSTAHQEHFKWVKNIGCLRLNFLLPAVCDSG